MVGTGATGKHERTGRACLPGAVLPRNPRCAPATHTVLRARPRKSRETDGPEPNRNDDDAFPPSGSFGRAAGGSIRENQPGNFKLVPNITRQQVRELA